MKKLFLSLIALMVFVPHAEAGCFDRAGNEIDPVAVADADGVFHVTMPDGTPIEVSGFPPYKLLCNNLLFKSTSRKCPSGKAVMAEDRNPRFCKRPGDKDNDCKHIVCPEAVRIRK